MKWTSSLADGNKLLVKGAPECVLERCTQVQLPDGSVAALTPELRAEIAAAVAEMSKDALRCLGFAVKSGSALKAWPSNSRATTVIRLNSSVLWSATNEKGAFLRSQALI